MCEERPYTQVGVNTLNSTRVKRAVWSRGDEAIVNALAVEWFGNWRVSGLGFCLGLLPRDAQLRCDLVS